MEIWFNPSCSKCRIAVDLLEQAGVEYRVRRYLEEPPTEAELRTVLEQLGLQPWDITRTGEPEAKQLNLDRADRDGWIRALAQHPKLIQRPIIVASDGSAYVARTEEAVQTAVRADRATPRGQP
jgi:arsenate reductase